MARNLSYFSADTLAALDRFIAKSDVPPSPRLSRESAIEVVVRDWLMGQGYLAIPSPPGESGSDKQPVVPALHVTDDTTTTFGEPKDS